MAFVLMISLFYDGFQDVANPTFDLGSLGFEKQVKPDFDRLGLS